MSRGRAMDGDPLDILTSLARELTGRLSFEQTLRAVVVHAAKLLGVSRTSLRVLDATQSRLIAVTRAGQPLHEDPNEVFVLGEGLMGWIAQHGEPIRLGNALEDPRFAHRTGMRDELRSFLGVPLVSGALVTGVLSAVSPREDHFTREHEQLATLLAAIAAPWVEVARLSRLSTVDPLTGALNRRGMEMSFPDGVPVAPPMSVVMVDLDHFKAINDRHGHAAGDEALKAAGVRLGQVVREGDAVVRYGGEEFVLMLPKASLEQGARVAERARQALRTSPVRAGEVQLKLRASFGVAELREGESRDEVLARADEALYRAKAAGRDRVEVAD